MKKQLIAIASVAMLAGVFTFSSCKKSDTTAPTLTITGGNDQTSSLNAAFTNPAATATDDVDGDLTTKISISNPTAVDNNTKGVYTLHYSVSDAAGNTATQDVTIHIVNDAEAFAGNYNVHDTVPTLAAFNYTIAITTDNTVDHKIHFGHLAPALVGFADYQNNDGIYANIAGSTVGAIVTLTSQTVGPIGTDNSNHTFVGNGTVLAVAPSLTSFNITYTDTDNTNSTTASGCVVTYTHQ